MARVSHKRVKQLLNEKRSKISDKQFFTSRILAGHYEDVAAAQSKRYRYDRRVHVNIYWNPNDNNAASTNNTSIAIHAAPYLGDTGVARIDHDTGVVGTSGISIVRIPVDVDMHSAVVTVTFGLSCCHIFKVACKDPGGEELLIRDLAPMFIQKLLNTLMTHSCHTEASFLRRPCGAWERRWVPGSQSSAFPDLPRQMLPC